MESLIDNAIKFSPANETITIQLSTNGQTTVCEFTDNGPGFSDKAIEKLFSVFGLGDQHYDKHTGLNLALTKLIMDLHHGRIEVRNKIPNGAIVRLIFQNDPTPTKELPASGQA